jgi:shikimate kinase
VLVGLPTVGKTTVGKLVAERLDVPFFDVDDEIEARAGHPVAALFAGDGEVAFRDLEEAVTADVLDRPSAVIGLGGGAVLRESTRARLSDHDVVWLRAEPSSLAARLHAAAVAIRPVLGDHPEARLAELAAQRGRLYGAVAAHVVDVDGLGPVGVADRVVAAVSATVGGSR